MKKSAVLSIAAITLALVGISRSASASTILYDSLPPAGTFNVASLGYQATQTTQFGELIQLTSSGVFDLTVTVAMSNWALESTYQPVGTSAGFFHDLTFNLFDVGAGNTVGSAIASQTVTALIPWRPEADSTCPGGTAWRAGDNNCYNGLLSEVSFSFGGVTLPNQLIYGLAYNTQTWGDNPIGSGGPFNSLNFGLTGPPSVGLNVLADTAFWDTATAGNYTDGGAGGVGVFRADTGWDPYNGAVEFTGAEVPEPTSMLLLGAGLVGVARKVRRRRS